MRKLLSEDQSLLQKIDELEKGSNKLFQIVFERLERLEADTPCYLQKEVKLVSIKIKCQFLLFN